MKQITCEICGGKNIIKRDGAYVCADCGIKYTADEIKKLLSNTSDDEPACSELPLENSESTPSNSTADRENPDKINHKSKIPLLALAACVCVALLVVAVELIIPNVRYNNAVSLMNDGKYEEAIAAFEAMDGYNDSAELITVCETNIRNNAYDTAVALMYEGKYEEAIAAFEALNGYKDSAEKVEGMRFEYETEKMKYAEVGDYIYFGSYEQDNNESNGKENIKWLVLAKEDNKVLVISRYALDCRPYNTGYISVTWETCALRTWLNGTFLNEAFSEAEQTIIQTTEVAADKNPDYSTAPGNTTTDKIFLLSINEADKYFVSDKARMCVPTAHAVASGAGTSERADGAATTCWWWLRSPGDYLCNFAAGVDRYGGIYSHGYDVCADGVCVRPAMWIDLST